MITHWGEQWGTAAELAHRLGTTVATIRNYARRDGLPRARITDNNGRPAVYYPLTVAARIEAAKRNSGRGRPRRIDTGRPGWQEEWALRAAAVEFESDIKSNPTGWPVRVLTGPDGLRKATPSNIATLLEHSVRACHNS